MKFAPSKSVVKRFQVSVTLLTLAFAILVMVLNNVYDQLFGPWTWGALAFFFLLTMFINWLSMKALNKSQKTFLNFVYGTTFIRFIFSIFFVVIYLIVNDLVEKPFIFSFVVFYLFYTTFEIYHLVTKLRTEK